ncbi:amidohydrolase family protein [Pimelobacter simplex]|uniref:amidohydrolase family protein n=1 Tax=Nocardioides simplex TaxID=2045 RepID=UPI0019325745|nr:amidohydrolase family protein [Pimelobacter simplex]
MTEQGTLGFGHVRPIDGAWFARALPEEALDPDLPVIDSHHHFFAPGSLYGRQYLLDDLRADLAGGHHVIATVVVEAKFAYRTRGPEHLRTTGETEAIAGLAAMSESGRFGRAHVGAGIIGRTDLTSGPRLVAESLDRHLAVGGGRFRGVRDSAAYDEDPAVGLTHGGGYGRYLTPEFERGMKELAARDLSLDAWVFFHQLGDVADLARRFPDTSIVLVHCGGPLGYGRHAGRPQEIFEQWRAAMSELAGCENVTVKLGGMLMRLAAFDYLHAERPAASWELAPLWASYVETCIELFGAERCMFDSNFPVERMGVTYTALVNTFKRITSGASVTEKGAIFAETARRVYRLEVQDLSDVS